MPKLSRIALRRWWQQDQLCVWCGEWTWHPAVVSKHDARERLGIVSGTTHAGKRLRRLKATAEHIAPKSLGGTNGLYNIACACAECNSRRSAEPTSLTACPQVFAKLPAEVREQMRKLGVDTR